MIGISLHRAHAERLYNDDHDNTYSCHMRGMELARFDKQFEKCAQAGVTIYKFHVNIQRANHDSDFGESWLDNFEVNDGFDRLK